MYPQGIIRRIISTLNIGCNAAFLRMAAMTACARNIGAPYGIQTRVTAVEGHRCCPPLLIGVFGKPLFYSTLCISNYQGPVRSNRRYWTNVGQRRWFPTEHGDGKSDIVWRDTSGNVAMWLMNGSQIVSASVVANAPTVWSIQGANVD